MLNFVYNFQDKFIDLKRIMDEVNKINGRRFKVVSFRWLTRQDI